MANENYIPINPSLANHFNQSIFHSENDLKLWLEAEKMHYGVTGNHIADNPQVIHSIWQASQQYDVDPMIVLVKLQQESQLLSTAYNQDKLDWAVGYGAYDCPGGGSDCWDTQYQGFENQITGLCYNINHDREVFENCLTPACKTLMVDGQALEAQTAADYIFYKYTPHTEAANLINEVLDSRKKTYDILRKKLELEGVTLPPSSWDSIYGGNQNITPINDPIYDNTTDNQDKINDILNQYQDNDPINNVPSPNRKARMC